MSDPRSPLWGPVAVGATSVAAVLGGHLGGLYPLTVIGVAGWVAAVAWATTLLMSAAGWWK